MPFRLRPHSLPRAAALAGILLLGSAGCDRDTHPSQLGRPAPQFALADGQHTLTSNELRSHVVLLNFWASWCAPCLVEMPSLEALQQQLPEIRVIGIAFDQDAASYQAYLQRHPLSFFTVLDTAGVTHTSFGTYRPPETYILDKNGIIRRKFIGAQDWTSPEIIATLQNLAH